MGARSDDMAYMVIFSSLLYDNFYYILLSISLFVFTSPTILINQFSSSFKACLALSISSFTLRNSSIWRARCSCKFVSCSSIEACSWLSAFSKLSLRLCLTSRICSTVSQRWASLSEEIVCINAACWPAVRFPIQFVLGTKTGMKTVSLLFS